MNYILLVIFIIITIGLLYMYMSESNTKIVKIEKYDYVSGNLTQTQIPQRLNIHVPPKVNHRNILNLTNQNLTNQFKSGNKCPGGYSTQPKPAYCTEKDGCIGDDIFHSVCPNSYTWPNDPQTYTCDSKEYTITFCPGGTSVPMSDSTNNIPNCSSLKDYPEYNYDLFKTDRQSAIKRGELDACAIKTLPTDTKVNSWAYGLGSNASCYNLGVRCKL